ncbi:MAG: SusC/RagA family TonB-linked outer membrane protein [Bacteroidales bacterium]
MANQSLLPILMVKGSSKGVSSDVDGKYIIEGVARDAILIFSSIGFEPLEIPVNGREKIDATLHAASQTLDQIMVVAFGTAKKSTFTGSAAVVDQEVFDLRPITEISQAIAGTTPGVIVGTSNGHPGSEPTIRVRGHGSFNASNSPLIVMDGMPYDNAFTSINPSDIESVTVLKDASSAALYGARAANGVLLVNTKRGKVGKPKVIAKYNLGITARQGADYELLGDRDYTELYWEGHRNALVLDGMPMAQANQQAGDMLLAGLGYNPYLLPANQLFDSNGKLVPNAINHWADDTNWWAGVTQVGKRHDTNVSISGANQNTDYYTSIGYLNEEGFMIGSQFNRISGKANVNSKITDWLRVGTNINTSHSTSEGEQSETSGAISNPFRATRFMGNLFPIHLHNPSTGAYILDADGNKMPDFGVGWVSEDGTITISGRDAFANSNHPTEVHNIYKGYLRQTINLKGYIELEPIKNLKLTVNGGLGSNMYRSWNGGFVYEIKGNAGSSSKNISNTSTMTFQQLLNYTKTFGGKHTIDFLAGHESYQYSYHYMTTSMKTQTIHGSNFEYANFVEINANPNSYTHNYRVEGYLTRVNYDFDEKYFASASFRRDGSSRFFRDVRWGNFWSIGGGWLLDKEEFMKSLKFVDHLKLRASYGVVGNDDLEAYYPWRATYSVNDNGEPGYVQSSLGNRNLTWETSRNFDLAAEFSLLKGRIDGSLEYFNRVSSDLLFSVPQPVSSPIETIDINAGSMYNKGVELSLDGNILNGQELKINLNANATLIKNKLVELPLDPYTSGYYKIEEGYSRYEFYVRQWRGVNPETGYNLFLPDLDNYDFDPSELLDINGVQLTENVNKAKYDWEGSAMPKVYGGFGTNINWKNFNLRLSFYYQLGGKFYYDAAYRSYMTGSLSYFAQHKDLLDRWREPGDITDIPRYTTGADMTNIEAASSSRWIVTSNMLELTNINLSYRLPKKILNDLNINEAIIYFAADNSLLLTAKKGLYPRRNFYSGTVSNADIYPPSRVFSVGISLTF